MELFSVNQLHWVSLIYDLDSDLLCVAMQAARQSADKHLTAAVMQQQHFKVIQLRFKTSGYHVNL